jgi:hypothetical protein
MTTCDRRLRGDPEVVDARIPGRLRGRGRACLLERNYERLNQLVDANFRSPGQNIRIDPGNLEMVQTARAAGRPLTSRIGSYGGTYTERAVRAPCGVGQEPESR